MPHTHTIVYNSLVPETIKPILSHLPLPIADSTELLEFCSSSVDRFEILLRSIKRRRIPYRIINISDGRHFLIPLSKPLRMEEEYYKLTLVAHYDCVENSPGANDNAASVFQLLAHWEEMRRLGWNHRTQILFTDKEELIPDMKIQEQGSYRIARKLKNMGAKNLLFIVLDMCGIGNTPVWGFSHRKAGIQSNQHSETHALKQVDKIIRAYTNGTDYSVISEFSDDLGLLFGGYGSIQLSLLPRHEARLMSKVQHSSAKNKLKSNTPATPILKYTPPSWRNIHSTHDKPENLEARSFILIHRLLLSLAQCRFRL